MKFEDKHLVFVGQPWIEPEGMLYGETPTQLIIRLDSSLVQGEEKYCFVPKEEYRIVPLMTYSQFIEWKKNNSGLPSLTIPSGLRVEEKKQEFSRFELMDLE